MKVIDKSKDVNYTIYRGAKAGIKKHVGGSFYSSIKGYAEDYATLDGEKNPCLYVFDYKGLNILVIGDLEGIDDGIENFTEEEIAMYDGVRTENYAQYLMFGTFDSETGVFEKQSYEELLRDANLDFRDYVR